MIVITQKTLFLLLLILSSVTYAEPQKVFQFDEGGVIWGFDFLDDQSVVLSKRSGQLFLIDLVTKKKTELIAPQVRAKGQGALLDIKVLQKNDKTYLYATYSKRTNEGPSTTALARADYNGSKELVWEDLFVAKATSSATRHFGSRLAIVEDYIFMTIGDRGRKRNSQKLDTHHGKVLRLNLDGSPAQGNPFADTPNALPEIWTLGHRNPQGIAYDPDSGNLYVAEFGPRGGDEINIIERGKNYGWPIITHGRNYSGTLIGPSEKEGLEQPFVYWVPSVSPSGIALFNDGSSKSILVACLSARQLRQVTLEQGKASGQKPMFEEPELRVRHVVVSKENTIYFSTDAGELYRL